MEDKDGRGSFLLEEEVATTSESTYHGKKFLNFQVLNFKELEKTIVSVGNIYWLKKVGTPLMILKAGDPIEQSFLNKYAKLSSQLGIEYIKNGEVIANGEVCLMMLQKARNYNEVLMARSKYLSWFYEHFWMGKKKCGLLDLGIIFSRTFYKFDSEMTNHLIDNSFDFFKRSIIVAPFIVTFAMALGYTDFNFLNDIYKLAFFMNYNVEEKGIGFNTIKAMERERQKSGTGVSLLFIGENPGPELDLFLKSPLERTKKIYEKFSHLFNSPDVINLIKRVNEKVDSKGFPFSFSEINLTDLEMTIILFNNLFTFTNITLEQDDGTGILKKLLFTNPVENISEILSQRIQYMISHIFSEIGRNSERAS
ncbi:MAG: hypothetical protein H6622_10520 [Halobacteriovoraceae bacterium]|nr:hypothetical protein [Halobacteriovoraceae bacterium]